MQRVSSLTISSPRQASAQAVHACAQSKQLSIQPASVSRSQRGAVGLVSNMAAAWLIEPPRVAVESNVLALHTLVGYVDFGFMAQANQQHGYDKVALIKRLHRIEGQVRGIERMVEDDRYCIDVLTQVGAVKTALESLAFQLLSDHVSHCVTGALEAGDVRTAGEKSRELLAAVQRFAKTS
jgi:DNA-binding FrmR family transcriptional regulator